MWVGKKGETRSAAEQIYGSMKVHQLCRREFINTPNEKFTQTENLCYSLGPW